MQIDANSELRATQGNRDMVSKGEGCFLFISTAVGVIKIIVKINNSFVCVGVGGRCNSYCSDITRNYEHRAHTK